MDAIATFKLVTSLREALPFALVLSISLAPFPRLRGMCAILAVLIAWIASVIYTEVIYNPAGIAAGHALGEDFPENRYDNNTIASTMLGGWIEPTLCVIVLAVVRRICSRIQKLATEVAPTEARTHHRPASPGSVRDAQRVLSPAG